MQCTSTSTTVVCVSTKYYVVITSNIAALSIYISEFYGVSDFWHGCSEARHEYSYLYCI